MHRTKSLTLQKACKQQDKKDEKLVPKKSEVATTPIAPKTSFCDDEYSPIQIRCTQDGGDDELDVIWDDYNSPQSRIRKTYHRTRKRTNNISPHVPRKIIHSKNNLIPKFSSLKAELEKLSRPQSSKSEETSVNNTCSEIEKISENLRLSPEIFNKPQKVEVKCKTKEVKIPDPFENDPFGDDSFDEELIKCSQQIEEKIFKPQSKKVETLINNAPQIADDSFDAILTEFTDEDIVRLSQENEKTPVKNTSRKFYRTNSTPINSPGISKETKCSTPLRSDRFPRTKSVNDCTKLPYVSTPVKTCSPEEIEKKRKEAKAKLELKKFQNEIEKKRLEALEKLKRSKNKKHF